MPYYRTKRTARKYCKSGQVPVRVVKKDRKGRKRTLYRCARPKRRRG